MQKIKNYLPAIIVGGAAVLALLFSLFLPGAKAIEGDTSASVKLIGMMFGSSSITASNGGNAITTNYTGGMSIFGLLSFIFLMAGIILIVVSLFVQGKKLDLIGACLIVIAGIFAFLLLVAGTNIKTSIINVSFKDFFNDYHLGIGVYFYAILTIGGGCFGIINNFKKIV